MKENKSAEDIFNQMIHHKTMICQSGWLELVPAILSRKQTQKLAKTGYIIVLAPSVRPPFYSQPTELLMTRKTEVLYLWL